jgi:hypothetical protein
MAGTHPRPLSKHPTAWSSEAKYRTLFESIDEGFCVIRVVFDAQGKAIDHVFLETNPSFDRQAGLVNAVDRSMRSLAPTHEEHWFRTYGDVAASGKPVRFEAPAKAMGRWYDVYAFRVGEPGQDLVAILFNDACGRRSSSKAPSRVCGRSWSESASPPKRWRASSRCSRSSKGGRSGRKADWGWGSR